MKNDAFLFVGIIIFLFVLWVYTGGPTKPISFAGPYITPVTNVGGESEGYGAGSSGSNYTTSNSGSFWGSWGKGSSGGSTTDVPAANRSPYAGKITLGGGNPGASDARQEYLTLQSQANTDVSITGWQLVSTKTGAHATIPKGVELANYSSSDPSSIVLSSGNLAIVTTGTSPVDDSFRETMCTGYLDSNGRFSPSLSNRCPSPLDELDRIYGGDARKYDQCSDYISTLSSCRVPNSNVPSGTSSSCRNFAESNLNYRGCISEHRNDADFRGSTWRIFLEESRELWRRSNETIQLLDANGKVVDQYSY
jgi:hypothetical protein